MHILEAEITLIKINLNKLKYVLYLPDANPNLQTYILAQACKTYTYFMKCSKLQLSLWPALMLHWVLWVANVKLKAWRKLKFDLVCHYYLPLHECDASFVAVEYSSMIYVIIWQCRGDRRVTSFERTFTGNKRFVALKKTWTVRDRYADSCKWLQYTIRPQLQEPHFTATFN